MFLNIINATIYAIYFIETDVNFYSSSSSIIASHCLSLLDIYSSLNIV